MHCRETISYADKKAAVSARNARMREDGGLELKIYRCPQCNGWHMAKRDLNLDKRTRAQKAARLRKGKTRVHLPAHLWKEELADE